MIFVKLTVWMRSASSGEAVAMEPGKLSGKVCEMRASKMWPLSILAASVVAVGVNIFSPAVADPTLPTPTAPITVDIALPMVDQQVTFTATVACNLPPCRYQWRWYRIPFDRLGSTMGEGEVMQYAFDTPGIKLVVLKVTDSGSTHPHVILTEAIIVDAASSGTPLDPTPPLDATAVDTTAEYPSPSVDTSVADPSSAGTAVVDASPPADPTGTVGPTLVVDPSRPALPNPGDGAGLPPAS